MVHEDAICWTCSILHECFRYMNRTDIRLWSMKTSWERQTLSVMDRFVPYHLCCAYVLRKYTRERLLVQKLPSYKKVEVPQSFQFAQESLFSYTSRRSINVHNTSLWPVAYTEWVVRVCVGILLAAYDEYMLLYVPQDIVVFSRQLDMANEVSLGSRVRFCEVLELLTII